MVWPEEDPLELVLRVFRSGFASPCRNEVTAPVARTYRKNNRVSWMAMIIGQVVSGEGNQDNVHT